MANKYPHKIIDNHKVIENYLGHLSRTYDTRQIIFYILGYPNYLEDQQSIFLHALYGKALSQKTVWNASKKNIFNIFNNMNLQGSLLLHCWMCYVQHPKIVTQVTPVDNCFKHFKHEETMCYIINLPIKCRFCKWYCLILSLCPFATCSHLKMLKILLFTRLMPRQALSPL